MNNRASAQIHDFLRCNIALDPRERNEAKWWPRSSVTKDARASSFVQWRTMRFARKDGLNLRQPQDLTCENWAYRHPCAARLQAGQRGPQHFDFHVGPSGGYFVPSLPT
jgi:hypothetical protein